MKHCPECNRNYADPTLGFCLQDGAPLIFGAAADEPATAILNTTDTDEEATRTYDQDPTTGQRPSERAKHITSNKNSLLAGVIGIILVTALGIGSYFYYGRGPSKQIDSIAVLPFVNESGNSDVEYLSDGMTESLINSLSTLPNLSVKARNTVFRYKGKEIDERKVGNELSVQAVLFGRFTQRGEDLTLSLSLVESISGNTLWGEQYDRKVQDLSALRNEIARDVAQKLRTRLSNAETSNLAKNFTANAEALRLYFLGRYFWEKRNPESIRKSIEYFNQAIEKDPNFARAYSGLADAYIVPASGFAPRDVMPKAKAAVTRALEIDNSLAEAHTSLARILQIYDWNWTEAEKEYKRALELDPRYPLAHQWYGGYLERTGRLEESIAERKVAVELDPLSASTNFELGLAYFYSRDYDRAIEQLQKALELERGFYSATQVLLSSYAQKGQYDLAIAKAEEAQDDNLLGTKGILYAMAGRRDDAIRVIGELDRLGRDRYISAASFAFIYAALGENDQAIAYLEKGYEERAFQMQFLKVDPRWDKLKGDPRFQEILKKVGLA
jgi:TolB-like protein/Tfp pilus assembly protein PilF